MNQMRENQKIVHGLARDWIADKSRALEVGEGHRDIMTLLGEYHYLCQVLRTLTVLQSGRTTPKTQRRDSLNTRWSPKYGWGIFFESPPVRFLNQLSVQSS